MQIHNAILTGSTTVYGPINILSGSLTGTSSYAATSSYSTAFTVGGTLTAQTLVVQTITASIEYSSGSNIFGSQLTDRQTFTGSMYVTGSTHSIFGNFGIGNVSPVAFLTVDGNATSSRIVLERDTVAANTVVGYIDFANSNATNTYGRVLGGRNAAGDGYVALGTGISTNLYALESGNVGIGLSNPSALLHISGSGSGSLFRVSSHLSSSIFFISGSGNVGIGMADPTVKLDVSGSVTDANGGIIKIRSGASDASIRIGVTSSYSWIQAHGSKPLYINELGNNTILNLGGSNVGIGTSSPSATLSVYNNTNDATYGAKIQGVFGPAAYQDSDATQNYGSGTSETQFLVGTTTRPAMISLGGDVNAGEGTGVINFFRSTNTDTYRSRAWIWSGINSVGTTNQYGGFLAFSTAADAGTNPQERMRITSSGSVSIGSNGTTNVGGFGSTVMTIQSPNSTYATLELGKATASTNANLGVLSFFNGSNGDVANIIGVSEAANNTGALRFLTSGSEKMRVTNSGSVGINTSTPFSTTKLHVVKDASTDYVLNTYAGSGILLSRTTGGGEQLGLRIGNASTNGISGTNYPGQLVSDGNNIMEVYTTAGSPLVLGTNSAERIRITGTGLVGINNSSPQARLDLGTSYGASGEKFFIYNDDNASALAGTKMGFYIDRFSESNSVTFVFPYAPATTSRYHVAYKNTGNTTITDVCYVTYNSTSWTFPSDERMKNVEGIITNALDKIKDLRAVYYTQKRDPEQKRKVGLLAQDLLKVLPEVVDVPNTEFDEEGNQKYMSVALGDTIPLLVKAIQELSTKLDEATTRIIALESK